ncbi:MlaD family protein [Chitinispirillales bacterium ANBcel5]|uniref:MlaD family protein n=1 Tax=Cellulosispirillum alkaliphilum TaxID=3039283 RepID=UPI002A50E96F|nr:MlaD family protein [Chitinispirillales bacterium ANBcel5]
MSDRKLGYIILSFLLLFIIISIGYFFGSSTSGYSLKVFFEKSGGLNLHDPVYISGVQRGSVQNITPTKYGIVTEIYLEDSIKLFGDVVIELLPEGLMGQRMINISPGTPNSKHLSTDTLLTGSFKMGPPEALAYVDTLHKIVKSLSDLSTILLLGSETRNSLIDDFSKACLTFDTIMMNLTSFTQKTNSDINLAMGSFSGALNQAMFLTQKASSVTPETLLSLSNLLNKTETLVNHIDELLHLASSAIEPLQDPDPIIGADELERMKKQLLSIREQAEMIRAYGLPLRIRFW